MLEFLSLLLVLACPLGMGAMMFAPALVKRLRRNPAAVGER